MVDAEAGVTRTPQRRLLYALVSRVFLQSFTLTFLAEWGDRSQIATIILAARDVSIALLPLQCSVGCGPKLGIIFKC